MSLASSLNTIERDDITVIRIGAIGSACLFNGFYSEVVFRVSIDIEQRWLLLLACKNKM